MQTGFPQHFATVPMRGAIEYIFTDIQKPINATGEILAKINPDGFTVAQLGRISSTREYVTFNVDGKCCSDIGIDNNSIMRYSRKASNDSHAMQVSVCRDWQYMNGYSKRLTDEYFIEVRFIDNALRDALSHDLGLQYEFKLKGNRATYSPANGNFDDFVKNELLKSFHNADVGHMRDYQKHQAKMRQIHSIVSKYI